MSRRGFFLFSSLQALKDENLTVDLAWRCGRLEQRKVVWNSIDEAQAGVEFCLGTELLSAQLMCRKRGGVLLALRSLNCS